jgi:hypothetical protein
LNFELPHTQPSRHFGAENTKKDLCFQNAASEKKRQYGQTTASFSDERGEH